MKFLEEPTFPGIAAAFERSFEVLEALPCDIFLASHAGFFGMARKRERMTAGDPDPFVDRDGYRRYIERARRRFEQAVAKEKTATDVNRGPQADPRFPSARR